MSGCKQTLIQFHFHLKRPTKKMDVKVYVDDWKVEDDNEGDGGENKSICTTKQKVRAKDPL